MAFNLTEVQAVSLVRKNIDEYDAGHNVMYDSITGDNTALDAIIKQTLPEAINIIHASAPLALLEGLSSSFVIGEVPDTEPYYQDITAGTESGNVITRKHVLRVVSCKASDSDMSPDIITEDSPEGRKQLDKRICGTHDNPRLVLKRGTDSDFRYYSHKSQEGTIDEFNYIEPVYYTEPASPATYNTYKLCDQLRDNYIYQLTGMVLAIFGNTDAAAYFFKLNENK